MGDNTTTVTSENFEAEVLKADVPVIVDLWATWCPPCRQLTPVLEDLAGQYKSQIKVVKVDVDHEQEIAAMFQVQSIPTMALLYKGALVHLETGFGGRQRVAQLFEVLSGLPEKVASGEIKLDGGPEADGAS